MSINNKKTIDYDNRMGVKKNLKGLRTVLFGVRMCILVLSSSLERKNCHKRNEIPTQILNLDYFVNQWELRILSALGLVPTFLLSHCLSCLEEMLILRTLMTNQLISQ